MGEWTDNYENENDPEEHYEELKESLASYKDEFKGDKDALEKIETALSEIQLSIDNLNSEYFQEPDSGSLYNKELLSDNTELDRSIFDDVDQ